MRGKVGLICAANKLVIFLHILAGKTFALIKVGKMRRALSLNHRVGLVSEFDAAEKLHQAYFAFISSGHNGLDIKSSYLNSVTPQ